MMCEEFADLWKKVILHQTTGCPFFLRTYHQINAIKCETADNIKLGER